MGVHRPSTLFPDAFNGDALKRIGTLNRKGMTLAAKGDFSTAFLQLSFALALTRSLNHRCLEAKILNSLGQLYSLEKRWDTALLTYGEAMSMAADHCGEDSPLMKTLGRNILRLIN